MPLTMMLEAAVATIPVFHLPTTVVVMQATTHTNTTTAICMRTSTPAHIPTTATGMAGEHPVAAVAMAAAMQAVVTTMLVSVAALLLAWAWGWGATVVVSCMDGAERQAEEAVVAAVVMVVEGAMAKQMLTGSTRTTLRILTIPVLRGEPLVATLPSPDMTERANACLTSDNGLCSQPSLWVMHGSVL